jgi:hypothetical protein
VCERSESSTLCKPALVAALALAMAAAGCTASAGSTAKAQRNVGVRNGSASLDATESAGYSSADSVPPTYGPITAVAGASQPGGGVWLIDSGPIAATVFFDSPSVQEQWLAVAGSSFEPAEAPPAIEQSAAGIVYAVYNQSLIVLNPATGATRTIAIPAARGNADAAEHLPLPLRSTQAADSIAVSPSGTVAIGMTNSSSVEEFVPDTGLFATVELPAQSDLPVSLAYAGSELVIGYSNLPTGGPANQVALYTGSGSLSTVNLGVPGSAWSVESADNGDFLVGSAHPELISPDGSLRSVPAPQALATSSSYAFSVEPGPNSELVGRSADGVAIYQSSGASTVLETPEVPCASEQAAPSDGSSDAAPPSTVGPAPSGMCASPLLHQFVVDSSGNVWVVEPSSPRTVAMIAADSASGSQSSTPSTPSARKKSGTVRGVTDGLYKSPETPHGAPGPIQMRVTFTRDGRRFGTTSSKSGRFVVHLPVGTYRVVPGHAKGWSTCKADPARVTVRIAKPAKVVVTCSNPFGGG